MRTLMLEQRPLRSLADVFIVASLAVATLGPYRANAEYQLVWSDEFEIDGKPDPEKWGYEQGFVRNQELQWYQPQNAYCRGGRLVIEGRRERRHNPSYRKSSDDWKSQREHAEYTSASLTTKGLQSWKYGRFEVKAKIKAESGLWPAIWFLGVEGEWPSSGEIDLMEYYRGQLLANACWGTHDRWRARWDSVRKPVESFQDQPWDQKFHVWKMDWDADRIQLYVDDQLLNTIDVDKARNPTDRGPTHPFRQPHYLLLNLAIGGTNGGDPSETPFPTLYEIEYVRVYRQSGVGE